jgi:hypothetical protein
MNEPASTINYYQTISPDMVLRQREKIAKWVFNIRDPKEAELIITNQGFLYFERNYHYYKNSRRPKQEIANKKEAEMKHADNFNKKMQATLSGDPMNPVAVTYFRWEHLRIEELFPAIGGSHWGSWEATIYLELPGVWNSDLQERRKVNVLGEYIRMEFTNQNIIKLHFQHLPIIRSESTPLIQTDKNGKKLINPISFRRIRSNELLPYYDYSNRLIPAINRLEEITIGSDVTLYDLPTPHVIGSQTTLLQILGGQGSDYKQGTPGLVTMQMNASFQIVSDKNQGGLQPEMIQAGQIQSLLERTIQKDLNGLVLTSTPIIGKTIFYRVLGKQDKLRASEYYRLDIYLSVKTFYQSKNTFLSAFAWAGYPSTSSQGIFCLKVDWPDTSPIGGALSHYYNYRKLELDSIFRNKKTPQSDHNLVHSLYTIRVFCRQSALSYCLITLIEERPEAYENSILVVGEYYFIETERDQWLNEKLKEYGILLFPDVSTALNDGPPGMTILDLLTEFKLRNFFSISGSVAEVMYEYLLIQPDFEYRVRNKIIKYYHICKPYGTAPVVILNPAMDGKSIKVLAGAMLEGLSYDLNSLAEIQDQAKELNRIFLKTLSNHKLETTDL